MNSNSKCWICESRKYSIIKKSNISKVLSSDSFAITDSSYGETTTLAKCSECGFIWSVDNLNVLKYYEELDDPVYYADRKHRALQAMKILLEIKKHRKQGSLLDIGAGTGIFVEEALKMGFEAEGVEPSKRFHTKARERNIPVVLGTFPHSNLRGSYEIITLIDVIEHINNPTELLREIKGVMSKNSVIVVVTPDVCSLPAYVLRNKWWHFRPAHIGYFNKKTLDLAMQRAGYKKVLMKRAKWYLALDYLCERILKYFPKFLRIPIPKFLNKITVPLNLRDSILAIYKLDV